MLTSVLLTTAISLSPLSIPLNDPSACQVLEYNGIPNNVVTFDEEGITLSVDKSAGPVIFPLTEATTVQGVKVKGSINGLINLPEQGLQGDKKLDDFALRVGLVIKGDKRLNWFQRSVAADWVLRLYGLAPKDVGIDQILFLAATQQDEKLNTQRAHPLSDLINEKFVWKLDQEGDFSFEVDLPESKDVLAVWLSSDGDDTDSVYQITYNEIILK